MTSLSSHRYNKYFLVQFSKETRKRKIEEQKNKNNTNVV